MRERRACARAAQKLGSKRPAAPLAEYLGNLLLKLGLELLGLGTVSKSGFGQTCTSHGQESQMAHRRPDRDAVPQLLPSLLETMQTRAPAAAAPRGMIVPGQRND